MRIVVEESSAGIRERKTAIRFAVKTAQECGFPVFASIAGVEVKVMPWATEDEVESAIQENLSR